MSDYTARADTNLEAKQVMRDSSEDQGSVFMLLFKLSWLIGMIAAPFFVLPGVEFSFSLLVIFEIWYFAAGAVFWLGLTAMVLWGFFEELASGFRNGWSL